MLMTQRMGALNNRTRKSAANALVGIFSQITVILLSFVSRSIFIRYLSTEYLGINGLFTNVLTVLSFAELGIGEALVYAMYKPMKEHDEVKLRQLMAVYKKAYRYIAITVGCIGIILSFFIKYLVAEKPDIPENFQLIFMLYLLNTVFSYLLTYKKSILLVDQKRYVVSLYQQVFIVIQLVLQSILLFLTHQYYIYLAVQAACTILGNIAVAHYVNKEYPYLKNKYEVQLEKGESQKIFSNVKALAISKIAGVVSNGSDNIVISKIIGLSTVGLASNYTLIINSVNGVFWSALSGVIGSIGNFNVDADVHQRRNIFNQLFLCSYWLYGFACICLMILINPFIKLWIGTSYLLPWPSIFALVLIIYIGGVNFPAYSFRTTLGYFNQVKYFFVASAVLNICLSIFLGLKIGLVGVYLATSISRLFTSEIADGYYVYKYGLELNPWKYLVKYVAHFGLFLLNFEITNFVVAHIGNDSLLGFCAKTVICVIVYNLVYVIIFFKTPTCRALLNRVNSLRYSYSKRKNGQGKRL